MKILVNISKKLILSLIILTLTSGMLIGVIFQTGILHEMIRKEVLKQLTFQMQEKITIDKLEGNLITQIKLINLRIYNRDNFEEGTVLEIGEFFANYNILKAINRKGDFAAASYKLHLKNPKVSVIRNKKNKWNALDLLPPKPINLPPPPTTFKGMMTIENLTLSFTDKKGWGETSLETPFNDTFKGLNGHLDFKELDNVDLNLSGKTSPTGTPISFNGKLNVYIGQYDINIDAERLSLDAWGPYVLTTPGFIISDNMVDVKGKIWSKNPFRKHEAPCWYDFKINVHDGALTLPFFDDNLSDITSELHIINGRLRPLDIKRKLNTTSRTAKRLYNRLINKNIINNEGELQTYYIKEEKELTAPLRSFKTQRQAIRDLLDAPPTTLKVTTFDGLLRNANITGKGVFHLSDNHLHLTATTDPFPITDIQHLFPGISGWKLSGESTSRFTISGKMDGPRIFGNLNIPSGTLYAFEPKNTSLDYSFHKNILHISVKKSEVYKGNITGKGSVNFKHDPPTLYMKFGGSDLHIDDVFPEIDHHVSGTFNIKSLSQGPLTRYKNDITIDSHSLHLFQQYISRFSTQFLVKNSKDIDIPSYEISLNDKQTSISGKGKIKNLLDTSLSFKGNALSFYDIDPMITTPNKGQINTLSGTLRTPLNSQFWKTPYSEIKSDVNISLNDFYLFNQHYNKGNISFSYNRSDANIKTFTLENSKYKASLFGTIEKLRPKRLTIETLDYPFHHSSLIQRYIPIDLKPFEGLLSGRVRILKKNKVPSGKNILRKYQVYGKIKSEKTLFQNQPIHFTSLDFDWNGTKLSLNDTLLSEKSSSLLINGTLRNNKTFEFNIKPGTYFNLSDVDTLLSPYGLFLGKGSVNGTIKGSLKKPEFSLNLDAKQMESPFISINEIKGNLSYKNKKIKAKNMYLNHQNDKLYINGFLDLSPLFSDNDFDINKLNYNLDVTLLESNLDSLTTLLNSIYKEIQSRRGYQLLIAEEKVTRPNINVSQRKKSYVIQPPSQKNTMLIFSNQNKTSLFDFYDSLTEKKKRLQKPSSLDFGSLLKGKVSGYIKAKSQFPKLPKVDTKLSFKDVDITLFKVEDLLFTLKNKKRDLAYAITMQKGNFANTSFQTLKSQGSFKENGMLMIQNATLSTAAYQNKTFMSGNFPLTSFWNPKDRYQQMNLVINLKNNEIGFLSFLSPYIDHLSNTGELSLIFRGNLENPVISSKKVALNNAKISWTDAAFFTSPFEIKKATINIDKNKILIPQLTLQWQGKDTESLYSNDSQLNQLDINGNIQLKNMGFLFPDMLDLHLNLSSTPTNLTINYPDFYQGNIALGTMQITGTYNIPLTDKKQDTLLKTIGTDLEEGPVISGNIVLNNGNITLPTFGKNTIKPSFKLNLLSQLQDNLSISGSLFGAGAISGIATTVDLDLEKTETPLLVTGTLNAPNIQNKLFFSQGTVSILNRGFEILPDYDQKIFHKDNPLKANKNMMFFTQSQDNTTAKNTLTPFLTLSALTTIDPIISLTTTANIEENISTDDQDKYKHILVNINGPLNQLDTLNFDYYVSNQQSFQDTSLVFKNSYTLSTSVASGDSYNATDTYNIAKLLLPELFIDENISSSQGFGELLLANQLQNILRQRLFRPLEKQLANRIGVDDLRVNYNMGSAISKSLGGTELGEQEQSVGINFTKLLSKNMFLRVRTDLDISTDERNTQKLKASELALTYYLLRNLSLNYANIREENDQFKPKVSLRYSYEF